MKLMIIDGNSILNRAYYGIRPLSSPDGTPTNAIYGFLNILNRLVNQYSPEMLCVAFDLKGPTFRHKAFDYYKAQRKPMPDDLSAQLPILKNILNLMGITILEKEGYEGDDILGSVSKLCNNKDIDCIVVTGDRDSLQLITDNTSVCLVKTSDNLLYDTNRFADEYGFEPSGIIDLKALMGDSSDNIPGVAGIGEKTANELIRTYKNIDEIYDNIDSLDIKASVKNKLIVGEKSARDSYWLASIFCDVPLEFSPQDSLWSTEHYKDGLYISLKKLGLNKIIQSWKIPAESLNEIAVDDKSDEPEIIPEGITVTDDLKSLIKRGFNGNAFDVVIAQYLINPTSKNYDTSASYTRLNKTLTDLNLDDLYYNIELPLTRVLASMEDQGILVDREALESFSTELGLNISDLQQNIYFQAGKSFNLNSPKQLSEVLFDDLGLPDNKKRSTNVEVLESLRPYSPIIDDILEYRELSKLKSTYTDGLQNYISDDGRIHTTFQQTVTATGRLSSTDPNLQNIPIRKELGSKLREMFVAPKGKVLIDADYSQIELRLLAHISDDKEMINLFTSGEDFHRATASRVFNIPYDMVSSVERSRAKAVNFGIVYGMSAFTLANDIHVSNSEAKRYMDSYFDRFSSVAKYREDIIAKAKQDGYVTTMFNRRRYIPELTSPNYSLRQFGERVALNMPIQGSAADIIKIAMNKTYNELQGYNAHIILQVHDELIIECDENECSVVCDLVKKSMEEVAELKVPLVVDVGMGTSWAEAH